MAVQNLEPYWDKLFQRQQSSALFTADLATCPGQDWPHATVPFRHPHTKTAMSFVTWGRQQKGGSCEMSNLLRRGTRQPLRFLLLHITVLPASLPRGEASQELRYSRYS